MSAITERQIAVRIRKKVKVRKPQNERLFQSPMQLLSQSQ